jgi:hypothetical protein
MSLESRLSERQFFMLSLAGLSALILVLFFAVLRPRLQERAELREQVESKTRQLQTAGYLLGEGPLLQKKREVEVQVQQRLEEWEMVTEHLSSFANQQAWQSQDVTSIDYKTYLYLTRNRLRGKAKQQKIALPPELGLLDLIESNDVARERMLQLLAVENWWTPRLNTELRIFAVLIPSTPLSTASKAAKLSTWKNIRCGSYLKVRCPAFSGFGKRCSKRTGPCSYAMSPWKKPHYVKLTK